MTKLLFCDYEILSADLGEENHMPDIKNVEYIHAGVTVTERFPTEEKANLGKGMINTLLPYTLQDNYNRKRIPKKYKAAILENSKLKAIFLPELGGRLWSLFDKTHNKELLYVNPVFQPGNLALRNAWFSGGVEWNIGIKGHNPLTCASLFACKMKTNDGEEYLRMYEYERIRDVVYYMDFILPEDSDILYVKTTIENTSNEDKYMYWWSNIAVPENEKTRVIAPCNESILTYYDENAYRMDIAGVPYLTDGGDDISYPKNAKRAQDYFYRIPDKNDKWIAAIDDDGTGLLQFSTPELFGRKLFVWGQGQGGKNWSRWLAGEDLPYIEIQAGLARTQYEHIIMKAKSTITFTEGYTMAITKPQDIFGEYDLAVKTIQDLYSTKAINIDKIANISDNGEFISFGHYGSGWGYIENLIRNKLGTTPLSNKLIFPAESITEKEKVWLDFLESGIYTEKDLATPPISYQISTYWKNLINKQISDGDVNASAYLQLGTLEYASGNIKNAYDAFIESNKIIPNAWAYRNLSMIEKNEYNNISKALEYIKEALKYNCTYRGLLVNAAQVMLEAKEYDLWIATYINLNDKLRKDDRLRLYKALAHIGKKEYKKAIEIINPNFELCDIKEGELSVSYIWSDLYMKIISEETGITEKNKLQKIQEEKYPLPKHLDFRMDK